MSVPAAYVGVILVWATTPLAIKWSGEGSHFLFGVTVRMVLGAILCLALVACRRSPLPFDRHARRAYLASGFGIYGGMTLSYWGALHIPSGWISVIFGLTPLFTAAMASLWLGERLTLTRLAGMTLGLAGLLIIYWRGAAFGPMTAAAIAAVTVAALVHSASAVWVKRLAASLPVLAVTAGGVTVAAVLDGVTWAVSGLGWPEQVTGRAWGATLYLGIGGSLVGFMLYFYLLSRLEATKTALITLVTPMCALLLGRALNGEAFSPGVVWGAAVIFAGLLFFQYGDYLRGTAGEGQQP